MLNWIKRSKELAIEFCERCSQVCDTGCRQSAPREKAFMQTHRSGGRL